MKHQNISPAFYLFIYLTLLWGYYGSPPHTHTPHQPKSLQWWRNPAVICALKERGEESFYILFSCRGRYSVSAGFSASIVKSTEQRAGETGPSSAASPAVLAHSQQHRHRHTQREGAGGKSLTDALQKRRVVRLWRIPTLGSPRRSGSCGILWNKQTKQKKSRRAQSVGGVVLTWGKGGNRTCRDTGCSSQTFLRVITKEVLNFTVRKNDWAVISADLHFTSGETREVFWLILGEGFTSSVVKNFI